jgi:hypothetical protein
MKVDAICDCDFFLVLNPIVPNKNYRTLKFRKSLRGHYFEKPND